MRAMTRVRRVALLALVASVAAARPPAVARAGVIAIRGARVFPVSGPPIENGTVVVTDGRITAVGAGVPVPSGARVIEARGKWVTPGLVNAATALGVVEIGAVGETNDTRARGDRAVAAAFRVWDGLNPASVLWAPAANEGITSAVVLPSGGLVAGQAAVVDTLEAARPEMVRRAPVAMVASLDSAGAANTGARGEMLMRLREVLDDARAYASKKDAFESGGTREFSAGRLHLEALGPVVAGAMPLVVGVDRASDIEAALDVANDYKLRLVVLGGAEAWKVAARLAAARVPVVTTALDNIPASFSTLAARQENAAWLRAAGVQVAIIAGERESFNVRNVRQHAGNAVAYGMAWNEALRAVTLAPAEIFGVDDAIGSIQVGRDANIVVWSGDPFEFATTAEHVFVRGRDARTTSRQDLLTDRYKPRQ